MAAAKDVLARDVTRRGFAVVSRPTAADYVLYTYYVSDPKQSTGGKLFEVQMARNFVKEGPLGKADSLPVFPTMTDAIAEGPPP